MHLLDADFNALLLVVAFVLAVIAVFAARGASLLAWACILAFGALAWNGCAVANWF